MAKPKSPNRITALNDIHHSAIMKLVDAGYIVHGNDLYDADVILLRSADIRDINISHLKAVGRVGVGVNNIPVDKLTQIGVPVFNTPGANANAVKEITIAGMIMASRHIHKALKFADGLEGTDAEMKAVAELSKRTFDGIELTNRTLCVVGLGSVGRKVAKAASALGMKVIGYDPYLDSKVEEMLSKHMYLTDSITEVFLAAQYLSFHVPPETRDLLTVDLLDKLNGTVVLNFSRDEVLDTDVILEGITRGKISCYVTDFPNVQFIKHEKVITLPHIGASTVEAKENCAFRIVDQVMDFLENGNVRNSVNFPEAVAPQNYKHRLVVANRNVPNMIAQISSTVASTGLNIENLVNCSKGEIAYSIIDVDTPPQAVCDMLFGLGDILMARIIR